MKKLFTLFVALIATITLWAGNTITYTATEKLIETTSTLSEGLHTNAFDVSITSHTFADGTGTITFDGEVTSIGVYAFAVCSGLTSVTIPNSVTSIGNSAFYYCSGLTSITIPNSVTSIGQQAFRDCSGLTAVHISDIVAWCGIEFSDFTANPLYIAHHLYLNGAEVTDLIIPNSVTSIGDWAFAGCSGLTSITCEAVTPPACDYWCFYDVDKSIPLYVPAESVEAYKTAKVWKDFTNILPIEQNALDNAIAPTDNLRKLLRDGQVLIQRGDMIYNLHGQVVE